MTLVKENLVALALVEKAAVEGEFQEERPHPHRPQKVLVSLHMPLEPVADACMPR